jgi:hypothetical protein
MVNSQELNETLENFENWISQTLADTAQSAKLLEQNSEALLSLAHPFLDFAQHLFFTRQLKVGVMQESVREVDTLAQGVAMNAVVIMVSTPPALFSARFSPHTLAPASHWLQNVEGERA